MAISHHSIGLARRLDAERACGGSHLPLMADRRPARPDQQGDQPALTVQRIQQITGGVALLVIAILGWRFLIASERAMQDMQGEGLVIDLMWRMMAPQAIMPYLSAAALMWLVMMIAMMIPAVLPMAVIYRAMPQAQPVRFTTFSFIAGYLSGWSAFALLAALLQWFLHARGWLHGNQLATHGALTAAILIAAGAYQLTPLKLACLARCRSPFGYFMAHWRDGRSGAFTMGARHGLFCIGCCWVLMLLMFAGGAMSVPTMALLSLFILAERLLPAGPWVARLPGLALIASGVLVLLID